MDELCDRGSLVLKCTTPSFRVRRQWSVPYKDEESHRAFNTDVLSNTAGSAANWTKRPRLHGLYVCFTLWGKQRHSESPSLGFAMRDMAYYVDPYERGRCQNIESLHFHPMFMIKISRGTNAMTMRMTTVFVDRHGGRTRHN